MFFVTVEEELVRTYKAALSVALLAALLLLLVGPAQAQGTDLPDASGLSIDTPTEVTVEESLRNTTGPVQVVVQLGRAPLALTASGRSRAEIRAYRGELGSQQDALLAQLRSLGGKELARLKIALNAVVIEIDAANIGAVANLPGVRSVRAVGTYELSLEETVPHIGATAVQNAGFKGAGIKVAVLDSGIDYTHGDLGGAGTLAAYEAAYGTSTTDPRNTTRDGLFPTAKVVDGYDFVGEAWPNGPLAPDPDPIDFEGHGTHVADIIAGRIGVAPAASLFAVKVCSAVSSSCNGIALLQGVEFSLDPNGDGDIADKVDVINMSLGSSYGQIQDDLSEASANAVRAGVVVVASAGNSADRPYITGSPSSTPEVIAVAQTTVPSDEIFLVQVGGRSFQAAWQPFSADPVLTSGPLQYGDGAGGNLLGCNPFPAGSLTGRIVLVDRGTCAISIKVSNAAAGGALAAIVANNASQGPLDPPPIFSFGGGTPNIPGYTVTRVDGTALKGLLGQTATIDPASAVNIVNTMVASSSRGPNYSFNDIKPDIGAPGASLSAEVGTGTGRTAFGGTSGAAPMVAGAAALLLEARPDLSTPEVKALLMNTGETEIFVNPVADPNYLAPITRIGGGEVRIDQAVKSCLAAWDANDVTGSLSFGYQPLAKTTSFTRKIIVRNYCGERRTFNVTPSFRYADDAASGAVKVEAPGSITVPPGRIRQFNVKLTVDPSKLPVWSLNGGSFGGDGFRLDLHEFDGYLTIADAKDSAHLAWQILPHRSADVGAQAVAGPGGTMGSVKLTNVSKVLDGRFDVFSLTGLSEEVDASELPGPGDNFAVIDLKEVGVRLVDIGGGQFGVQFAVSTYGRRAHPSFPAEFDVYLDTNRDGTPDYVIFTAELGLGFAVTGQNAVYVQRLGTTTASAFFFTDADLNSENVILTAPLSALGLTPSTQFDFSVFAFDNYFTGSLTDAIEDMTYTLDTPLAVVSQPTGAVPANGNLTLNVQLVPGGAEASPSQIGLLIFHRDNKVYQESTAIYPK